jgi:5'-nucleotidase
MFYVILRNHIKLLMSNRRRFIQQSSLAATALLAARPFKTFAGLSNSPLLNGDADRITILHTNDICNQLSPLDDHSFFHNTGGFRNTAGMIASVRSSSPNVLLLDAGNSFGGNIKRRDEHTTTLRLMQQAGYDAILPGNRDLEAGTDFFLQQSAQHTIPVIASNYTLPGDMQSRMAPYTIVQKGNIRTGIIAAGCRVSNHNIGYKNPLKELDALAMMLKKEKKCDLVICLSQLGFENKKSVDDIQLARQSTAIDVIIGGRSRDFMQQPSVIRNRHKSEVIVNHAGHSGIVLGRIEIGFNGSGVKTSMKFGNRMVNMGDKRWKHKGTF